MPFESFYTTKYFIDKLNYCPDSYKEKGENHIDEKTQCNKCRDDYYQCRQAFFIEKQANILEQSANNQTPQIQPTQPTNNYSKPLNNCSSYQQIIKELQTESEQLAKNLDEAISQGNACKFKTKQLLTIFQETIPKEYPIDAKVLFIQNIFSYQNLPLFIAIILIALLYIFKPKLK